MRTALVGITISVALLGAVDHANGATQDKWQPCHYEDASGQVRCVWDAGTMGNGEGHSFFHNRQGFHYISHAQAVKMLAR